MSRPRNLGDMARRLEDRATLDRLDRLGRRTTVVQVLSRDGATVGNVVGERQCRLGGCSGVRIGVRWPDGKMTWPCSNGMEPVAATLETWRIS